MALIACSARFAGAADQLVLGKKLLLEGSAPGKEKLVSVAKSPSRRDALARITRVSTAEEAS